MESTPVDRLEEIPGSGKREGRRIGVRVLLARIQNLGAGMCRRIRPPDPGAQTVCVRLTLHRIKLGQERWIVAARRQGGPVSFGLKAALAHLLRPNAPDDTGLVDPVSKLLANVGPARMIVGERLD